jgi:hypothetical protein
MKDFILPKTDFSSFYGNCLVTALPDFLLYLKGISNSKEMEFIFIKMTNDPVGIVLEVISQLECVLTTFNEDSTYGVVNLRKGWESDQME